MMILDGIHDYQAGVEGLALSNHREVQIFYRPTEAHKISGHLFSLYIGFSAPNFAWKLGTRLRYLGRRLPMAKPLSLSKVLLGSALLKPEVFLEGLPSHCCLF